MEVWKYINKRRRRKEKRNNIDKKEWERHFQKLLERIGENENDVPWLRQEKKRKNEKDSRGEKDEIKEEEIDEAVKRMKKDKTAGVDEISIKAWLYGENTIKKGLIDTIK